MATITISVDPTYPAFAALDPLSFTHVSVGIGPRGLSPAYMSYNPFPATFASIGDAGVNPASGTVSVRRPLTFSRAAFAVFGNVTSSDVLGRMATILSNYVLRGVLVVTDDATSLPLTPDDVLTFVP